MTDQSVADAKIHILALVGSVPGVSYPMLMDKCLSSLYMDFFTFSRAYEELIAGNLMDKSIKTTGQTVGDTECLTLSEGGKAVLTDLKATINPEVKLHLERAAEDLIAKKKADNSPYTLTEPAEDNKIALILKCGDFEAKIFCEDMRQADELSKKWKIRGKDLTQDFKSKLED